MQNVDTIFGGDFNFCTTTDAKFSLDMIEEDSQDDPLATFFDEAFVCLTELHQAQHTRKQILHNRISSTKRLDRIYTSIAPVHLQDMRPYAATTHILTDPLFPSDHVPVRAVLHPALARPSRMPRISPWITAHPHFKDLTTQFLEGLSDMPGGLAGLSEIKEVLHITAKAVQQGEATKDPEALHLRLHWALLLARSSRSRNLEACRKAIGAFPSLRPLFCEASGELSPAFHDFVSDLARNTIDEQIASLEHDTERAEWRKLGQREALKRRAAAWAPRRRLISSFSIVAPDMQAASDQQHAAILLKQHWQPVFSAPLVNDGDIDAILEHSVEAPPDFDWEIREEDFAHVLNHLKDSAPGPDGIPYSAWANADSRIGAALRGAFYEFLSHPELPENFNHGNLVFLPKGSAEGDHLQLRRRPEETRPIMLSNTDAKIFAMVINHKLSQLAQTTVVEH
jgi:hypothetical protein